MGANRESISHIKEIGCTARKGRGWTAYDLYSVGGNGKGGDRLDSTHKLDNDTDVHLADDKEARNKTGGWGL